MTPQQRVIRRQFLGTTVATACGILMFSARGLGANPMAAQSDFPATDHFWYRPQPAGPYIDSQRKNKAFGRTHGEICLSEDNGRTWPHRMAFPDADRITFSCILRNGIKLYALPGLP